MRAGRLQDAVHFRHHPVGVHLVLDGFAEEDRVEAFVRVRQRLFGEIVPQRFDAIVHGDFYQRLGEVHAMDLVLGEQRFEERAIGATDVEHPLAARETGEDPSQFINARALGIIGITQCVHPVLYF